MNRRHQVFVSSTYEDLKEERQAVTLTLLEHSCIPVGMELFPAADHDPWQLIQKVIEESDYYMLILAGKYGSSPPRRKHSYTEREYRYAVKMKKPVVVFLRDDLEQLPKEKIETDPAKDEKLNKFRNSVKKRVTTKPWSTIGDLKSSLVSSIHYLRESSPQPGWIQADEIDMEDALLGRMAKLERDFQKLKGKSGFNIVTKYDNYRAAEAEIRSIIETSIQSSSSTVVRILGVSLKYSWKTLKKIIEDIQSQKQHKLRLELAHVSPEHLEKYGLPTWAEKSRATSDDVKSFAEKSPNVSSSIVKLTIAQYENLPHWHGILINDSSLYLGRCNWECHELDRKPPRLFVGETTYRVFSSNDLVGGLDRIALFNNWYKFYKNTPFSNVLEYGKRQEE